MQYKIRMLVSDGPLQAGETYWAEEFPSQPDWMFAENLRVPKWRVNDMFEYVGIRYVIPGVNKRIYMNETRSGYEVHVSGMRPFQLNKYSKKTFFINKKRLYITLRHNGDNVTHEMYEGIAQEYA